MTFPQRLANDAQPGELSKRPHGIVRIKAIESGRDGDYLAMVRECPCIKCGLDGFSEAAHVRMNSAAFGKRQAKGKKPPDRFSVPLCTGCHTRDPDSQHKVGEAQFWHALGINPLIACEKLFAKRGDIPAMRAVIFNAMADREVAEQHGVRGRR
jgi:hypothetical protein